MNAFTALDIPHAANDTPPPEHACARCERVGVNRRDLSNCGGFSQYIARFFDGAMFCGNCEEITYLDFEEGARPKPQSQVGKCKHCNGTGGAVSVKDFSRRGWHAEFCSYCDGDGS